MSKTKFQVPLRPATHTVPSSAQSFADDAAMVQSQTAGRPLKPIRVNFDMEPDTHRRLKIRAIERGQSVAELVRGLIDRELSS